MAANGLINGNIEDRVGATMGNSNSLYQSAVNDAQNGRMNSIMEMAMPPPAQFGRDLDTGVFPNTTMPGIPPQAGGSGYQQFDEGVEDIGQIFQQWYASHHANTPDRGKEPDVDSFDAFMAGVEYGKGGPLFQPEQPEAVEEFGTPYAAPNVDEFEGFAEEGTPGFSDPKGEYRQQTPGFSIDPNDPRYAHQPGYRGGTPQEGIPAVVETDPIDISAIPTGGRGGS